LVPSTTKPKFEVSLKELTATLLQGVGRQREEVLIAPNDLVLGTSSLMSPSSTENSNNHPARPQYVVLGLGKTATDAVVHLLTKMDIPPANIHWVVPQDVFMFVRPRSEDLQWDLHNPWKSIKDLEQWFYQGGMAPSTSFLEALLKSDGDADKAWSMLEEQGVAIRVLADSYDKGIGPLRVSRSAMIDRGEVALTRSIPKDNLIREGRIKSLVFIPQREEVSGQEDIRSGRFELTFQNNTKISYQLNTVFVDCTSPGPFPSPELLSTLPDMFTSDRLLTLGAIFLPPISWSMATLAEIETARRLHQLDCEALTQMAKMAVQIPLDEPGVALTGSTSEVVSCASPPIIANPQLKKARKEFYSQRPGESFENFALRVLLRQGPLALKDPARFAVLRKEAVIYVMLGPRKFRDIAEDNRLSQSAFRSFMFENIRAGAPFRRGVYEWVRDLRRKCDGEELIDESAAGRRGGSRSGSQLARKFSPAEKDLLRYLEPRLQQVQEVSSFLYRLESLGQMFCGRRGRRAVDVCGRRVQLSLEGKSFSTLFPWFLWGVLLAVIHHYWWQDNAMKKMS